MANTTRVQITGLRELGEKMKELSNSVNKKISRRAVQAGARVLRDAAKERAPVAPAPYLVDDGTESGQLVQPRNIQRNIVTKNIKGELTAEAIVAVRGKRKHGYASRIASLQEFGTVKQAPQSFMRPAFDEKKEDAAKAIVERLRKEISEV